MFLNTNSLCFFDRPPCPLHFSRKGVSFEGDMVPHPELSIDHTVHRHLSKQFMSPANTATQVSVNGCSFVVVFLFFESLAVGFLVLYLKLKAPKQSL